VVLLNLAPFLKCLTKIKFYLQLVRLAPEIFLLLAFLVANDSFYYGEFALVPYNFVKVNVFCGVSDLFGTQPLFSHLFFAFVLLGVTFPVFLYRARKFRTISISVALFVAFYSVLGHKEMRFLLPIIPFCNIVAAGKARKFFYLHLASLLVSIYIGMTHQNVDSSIRSLQNEILSLDLQNEHRKDIRVFLCLHSYLIPTYPFLPNERVHIDELYGNPDVYSKIPRPRIYKRFRNRRLLVDAYSKFMSDLEKNFERFVEYDLVLMHRPCYKRVREIVDKHFVVARVERYYPWFCDWHACAFVYILKNKKTE